MARVLVTGADGFIGSHLTEKLLHLGHDVRALVQYNSFNSWGWLDNNQKSKDIEIISGDIRDAHFCDKLTANIDQVFHLAALIAIPYSYHSPQSYVDTNVTGTLNLCHASLKNQVNCFIHTSTSEVYGTARYVPIDEKHPLQPQSPYSASKISADAMAMSFYNSFKFPLAIARPFNTYGPRQSARAVIPTIITQLANNQKTIKLGDIHPTRDFNFVSDTCDGFIKIANSQKCLGEVINIGSNTEISVGDLVQLIAKLMKKEVTIQTDEVRIRPEKSEVHRLVCDNTKIRELTDFSPQYNLENGLVETIEWFSQSENLKKYKSDIYNV